MVGKTNIKIRPNDQALAKAKLLMHFNDNIYDAKTYNNPTMFGTELYGEGRFGRALYLNGSSCIQMPLTSGLTLGDNDFTIAGWYFPYKLSGLTQTLFSSVHYVSSTYGFQGLSIWLSAANVRFCCDTASNKKTRLNTSKNLVIETWYHFALVRSGDTVTLYIDGVNEGTLTVSGSVYQHPQSIWRIGATNARTTSTTSTGNQEYFGGLVDEFIIVNGAALWTEDFTPPGKPYFWRGSS